MNILIVNEGSDDFWCHISIGFHLLGHNVYYVSLYDNLALNISRSNVDFDLIITNQMGIHEFAALIRDNRDKSWKEKFKNFLMIQFHDIGRELPTIVQGGQILAAHGIGLTYMASCRESFEFMKKHQIYKDVIYSHFPISFDYEFSENSKINRFEVKKTSDLIVRKIKAEPDSNFMTFFPKIIYIGAYFFDGKVCLRSDGPIKTLESFMSIMSEYKNKNNESNRFGFINYLYDSKIVSDREIINGIAAEYMYNYCCLSILSSRRDFVVFSKNTYGGDFHLYGKEWMKFGVDSIDMERAADNKKYKSSFISVDFGSTYLDISIYQRTMQIIGSGGRLLQLKQADSDEIYGDFSDHICFESKSELKEKVDKYLSNPLPFIRKHEEFLKEMRNKFNEKKICQDIFEATLKVKTQSVT